MFRSSQSFEMWQTYWCSKPSSMHFRSQCRSSSTNHIPSHLPQQLDLRMLFLTISSLSWLPQVGVGIKESCDQFWRATHSPTTMNKQIIAPYKKWMVGPKSVIPDQNYLIIGSNGQQPVVFHEHPMQSSEVKLTLLPTPNPTRNFSKSIESFNFERFIFDGSTLQFTTKRH